MTARRQSIPAPVTTSVVNQVTWDPLTVSGSRWDAVLFTDVDLSDFEDRGASFNACTFRGIRFNASTHVDAAFTNCAFTGCNFFDVRFTGCKLVGSTFDRCAFDLLAVEGGDWSLAGLRGADLRKATFHGVRLREADLTGARFEGAAVRDTDLSGAWMHGASFRGADLRGSDLSALDPLQCDVADALIDVEQAMVIAAALGLRIG
jgi:fluoroquinolone resistance protein